MEKGLRRFLDNFPVPFVVTDGQGCGLVNHAGLDALGCDSTERAWEILSPLLSPVLDKIVEKGQAKGMDITVQTDHGSHLEMEASGAHMDQGLKVILLYDLTGLKRLLEVVTRSRDKFRTVFDVLEDIVVVIDRNLVIQNANMAAARWLGTDIRTLIGKDCRALYATCMAETTSEANCPVTQTLSLKRPVRIELILESHQGERRWFTQLAIPIMDHEENVVQVAFILRDIHERKTREIEIESLNRALDKKNRELEHALSELKSTQASLVQAEKLASIGSLAAGMAHEINNPIGFVLGNIKAIRGYAADLRALIELWETLEEKVTSCKTQALRDLLEQIRDMKDTIDFEFMRRDIYELLDQCEEGLSRVTDIVKALKAFSNVDQARLKDFDINSSIKDTLKLLGQAIKNKGITVETHLSPDLPMLLGRPLEVNEAMRNIIQNAIQAVAEGGRIWIRTSSTDSPQEGIKVEVRDDGCGMTDEVKKKVFDPFFTTRPVGAGRGLGLSHAYSIISGHHGTVEVESSPGKGSRFVVFFPLLDEKDFQEKDTQMAQGPLGLFGKGA